jgi:peptidoglycan hydrolase-like protein with peptidoglycan-binding domain
MDEVRRPGIDVRASPIDRVAAPAEGRTGRQRLLVSLTVVASVLAIAIAATYYIWRGVGAPAPAASPEVQEIEHLLQDLGFTPGPVDGVLDAETQTAIRAFQQVAGMAEDGTPSPALLDELRAVAGGQ